jgi:hypothetical protein
MELLADIRSRRSEMAGGEQIWPLIASLPP